MKKKATLALTAAAFLLMSGCAETPNPQNQVDGSASAAGASAETAQNAGGPEVGDAAATIGEGAGVRLPDGPIGLPQDYVPFEAGATFDYVVTVGEVEPVQFRTEVWPHVSREVRSRFRALLGGNAQRTFALKLRVAGPAPGQGRLQWDGVKVDVLADELGIYEGVQDLYWARSRGGDFDVLEVRTYAGDAPDAPSGPWGSWSAEPGESDRILFFANKPGIGVSLNTDAHGTKDQTVFAGLDEGALHFVRTVEANKNHDSEADSGPLDEGFEEHYFFRYRQGLVRFEQKVGGQTSMMWTLAQAARL